MRGPEKTLLAFCGAVLDFAWLYAWAAFSMTSLGREGFPFVDAAMIFAAAAVLARLHADRGLRIITVGLLQGTGLAAAALRTIYIMGGKTGSFFDDRWFTVFFAASHSAIEWVALGIALFWSSALWLAGAFFAVRSRTHQKICSRFDLGLAAFFVLALIKLVAAAKGNVFMADTMTGPLAFVFFFFGLVAIGMTRTSGRGSPGLVRGRRKFGVVLGFICAVFLSAMGLVLFFQQPLARAAWTGYGFLRGGAASAGGVFLWFIRLLYAPRQGKLRETPSDSGGSVSGHFFSSDSAPWFEAVGKILAWLFGTFLGVMILIATVAAVIYVVRWLFSRTGKKRNSAAGPSALDAALRACRFIIRAILRAAGSLRGYRTAADLYRSLKGWSKRSGLPQGRSETPSEFSARLSSVFPHLGHEITSITEAFNREYYGEMALTTEEMGPLRANRRRLASPSFWPARFKTLIAGPIRPRS